MVLQKSWMKLDEEMVGEAGWAEGGEGAECVLLGAREVKSGGVEGTDGGVCEGKLLVGGTRGMIASEGLVKVLG